MTTKAALILALALIICTGMYLYFSPYHTCIRLETKEDEDRTGMRGHIRCAALLRGHVS